MVVDSAVDKLQVDQIESPRLSGLVPLEPRVSSANFFRNRAARLSAYASKDYPTPWGFAPMSNAS